VEIASRAESRCRLKPPGIGRFGRLCTTNRCRQFGSMPCAKWRRKRPFASLPTTTQLPRRRRLSQLRVPTRAESGSERSCVAIVYPPGGARGGCDRRPWPSSCEQVGGDFQRNRRDAAEWSNTACGPPPQSPHGHGCCVAKTPCGSWRDSGAFSNRLRVAPHQRGAMVSPELFQERRH
jgi:hypothetical protein